MTKYIIISFLALFIGQQAIGQNGNVGIGTTSPDASAVLDIAASDKGLLIPRVENTAAINSPAAGLLIYDNSSKSFKYYDGTMWKEVGQDVDWSIMGNDLFNANTGNVGIGTNTPSNKLTVDGDFLVNQDIKQFYVPNWTGGSGTIINGVFDGLGEGPQIRLQGVPGAGYVDIGNDSVGNFVVETNADKQRLIVAQSGNVGIGTVTPQSLLHLYNTDSNNNGAGSRLIFGDDLLNGRTNVYVGEWGWQTNMDSDILELSGFSGIKFTTGSSSANTPFEITSIGDIIVTGKISGVTDPTDAQDAATKAYVDLLEARLDSLLAALPAPPTSVQQRLNAGLTPLQIYSSGINIDSLYGKTYQGGLIFYFDPNTGNGLVSAPADQGFILEWGCEGTDLPNVPNVSIDYPTTGPGAEIGDGITNTANIIGDCGYPGAAETCIEYSGGGFSDWFLPSVLELEEMYTKIGQGAVGSNQNIGGFGDFNYWSSSEFNATEAWYLNFRTNDSNVFVKTAVQHNVRAIRAF